MTVYDRVPRNLKLETLKAYFDKVEALKHEPAALCALGSLLLAMGCAKGGDTMPDAKRKAKHMLEGVEALIYQHWDMFKQAKL